MTAPSRSAGSWLLVASLGALLPGCSPELGPCDELSSRSLSWDQGGAPAYAGQALMIRSCGHGAFCHSKGIDPEDRFGVPLGLDYDLRLADSEVDRAAGRERLEFMHRKAFEDRARILRFVENGRMPIPGDRGTSILDAGPRYSRISAEGALEELPGLGEPEGREILRNWLACGLPIVEATTPHEESLESIGDIADVMEVGPLRPSWSDIHTRLILPRCASGPCHGSAAAGGLGFGDEAESLAAMVDVAAAGQDCGGGPGALVIPGSPNASLLIHKLEGRDAAGDIVCGSLMPIGGSRVSLSSIAAIRQWVANGALAD